jgi:hypothetical protein
MIASRDVKGSFGAIPSSAPAHVDRLCSSSGLLTMATKILPWRSENHSCEGPSPSSRGVVRKRSIWFACQPGHPSVMKQFCDLLSFDYRVSS